MELAIIIIACVINLALGTFVLLRDTKARFGRVFFVMTSFLCLWIVSSYITELQSQPLVVNDVTNRLAFVGGYGALLSGLIFTYLFPIKRKIARVEKRLVVVISALIFGLSATPLVAGMVSIGANGAIEFSNGPLVAVYVACFAGVLALIVRNLVKLPKHLDRNSRSQAHVMLLAFALTALAGILLNVVIPIFTDSWDTTRLSSLSTVILASAIVYAVVRHGLFDVRLAVVRTSAYVLSLLTLGGLYYAIAFTLSQTLLNDTSLIQPLGIVLALLLAFIFQPIKRFFDKITNKLFYKDNYNIDDFFGSLNRILNSTTNLTQLLERSATVIAQTLKAEEALFFIYKPGTGRHLIAGTEKHSKLAVGDADLLGEYSRQHPGIIVGSELEQKSHIRRLLLSNKLVIVVPLLQNDVIIGYLCLGEHRASSYSNRDIKVLGAISDELIIAIQNALSVQEVKDLNATLQQRVDEATKELRASNAQLQKLDEAKDEFISMASHQLRTPLTSIKGYISMLVEGDVGKVSPEQKHLLDEAFISSERMVRLIGDFLNVSRLQTGKFIIERHPVNLAKVVAQEIESLEPNAAARGMKFTYSQPKVFPDLNIDESKIRQVIMNFADNAIYYSKEGKPIKIALEADKKIVTFTVKDSGIGVPEKEKEHLFNKFFRATNARKQRPDGTGVGLFLAKKVIDAHDGEIIFESKEGRGSTFGFSLPIK